MKLKEQYKDVIITKGEITLDTTKVSPQNYEFYYKNGFSEVFEVDFQYTKELSKNKKK